MHALVVSMWVFTEESKQFGCSIFWLSLQSRDQLQLPLPVPPAVLHCCRIALENNQLYVGYQPGIGRKPGPQEPQRLFQWAKYAPCSALNSLRAAFMADSAFTKISTFQNRNACTEAPRHPATYKKRCKSFEAKPDKHIKHIQTSVAPRSVSHSSIDLHMCCTVRGRILKHDSSLRHVQAISSMGKSIYASHNMQSGSAVFQLSYNLWRKNCPGRRRW